ncbi:MAG TPA: GNAT family protein [Solirubrobacterales bacterium]
MSALRNEELPTLVAERLLLRGQRKADLGRLEEIVTSRGGVEWWGIIDNRDKLRRDLRCDDEDDSAAFTIEVDGGVAGWLGVWEENEPSYRYAGVDIMLAPENRGRGIGPEALRAAIRWLIDERGHHRITIDPARDNERAIRAYESVGFRPVGVMRQYERDPAGGWRDGLLMDLLADELQPG